MMGWFLNILGLINNKEKAPEPELKVGDKIVLDNGVEETIGEKIKTEYEVYVSPCMDKKVDVEYETIEESIEKIDEYEERETLSASISAVFKELNEMPQEEFDALIDKQLKKMEENKCHPDTCGGECQGMGWCDTAREFREKIIPTIVNK